MKLFLILALVFAMKNNAECYHNFFFRSADDITSGTLDPARLDPSSVTLQGNNFILDNLNYVDKPYDIVVGTPGATGIDLEITEAADINTAITRAGVNGTVFFRTGVYPVGTTRINADGVSLLAAPGSSVVWRVTDGTAQMLKITNATVDGVKIDAYGTGITTNFIDVSTGGRFTNFDLYGSSQNPTGDNTYRFSTISVNGSTDVVIQGTMREFYLNQDAGANEGENANIKVFNSTGVTISLTAIPFKHYKGGTFGAGNNVWNFIHTVRSNNVKVVDGTYKNFGGTILRIGSKSSDVFFERNKVEISTWTPVASFGDGVISFENRTDGVGPYTSTGTISISYNSISVSTNGAGGFGGNFIWVGANGDNASVNGVIVSNNSMTFNRALAPGPALSTMRFATIAATSHGTILRDNYVDGVTAFIADSGENTVYTSLGNVFRGAEQ